MSDTNEQPSNTISNKMCHDIEEFLFNLTGGDGEAAITLMAAAELFSANPRLAPLILQFQKLIRDDHGKQAGHKECTHEEYSKQMWEAINKALPYNSDVRDYIDFVVD